jgi:hypothetical protein
MADSGDDAQGGPPMVLRALQALRDGGFAAAADGRRADFQRRFPARRTHTAGRSAPPGAAFAAVEHKKIT